MSKWQISGNLDEDNGVKNYPIFKETLNRVFFEYSKVFGNDVLLKNDFFVDNALTGSGWTPIITLILNKYLIIKLGIDDGVNIGKTVFQFAHEITHLLFFSLIGLNKVRATDEEEAICTASSLCAIALLCPSELDLFKNLIRDNKHIGYKNGLQVAIKHNFDLYKLKETIIEYSRSQKTVQKNL